MYEIEKNVPIPPPQHTNYPFGKMVIGDSFFSPAGPMEGDVVGERDVILKESKMLPCKEFRVKMIDGGVRCWRVR